MNLRPIENSLYCNFEITYQEKDINRKEGVITEIIETLFQTIVFDNQI